MQIFTIFFVQFMKYKHFHICTIKPKFQYETVIDKNKGGTQSDHRFHQYSSLS